MDKATVITKLGNIIMRGTPCTLEKEDTEILFSAYKLLMEYRTDEMRKEREETGSGWEEFDKFVKKREEQKYLEWRNNYVRQLTWFYKYLGLPDAHVVGDFLCLGSNDIMGYDLKKLYAEIKKEDEIEH